MPAVYNQTLVSQTYFKCFVDRQHAERLYMSYAAHAYRHEAHVVYTAQLTEYRTAVTTAYRMSTRSVWLLLQPPPRPTCLWSTSKTTGNPQLISINFSRHSFTDLQTSVIYSFQN